MDSSDSNNPGGHPCEWSGCPNFGAETTLRCSSCKKAWYCSPECQKYAWTFHIFQCKPNTRIKPAYHLAKACADDEIPKDPQTRRVFGFDNAARIDAEGKMVGLYQGLFLANGWKLEPREIEKWVKEGTLIQNIKTTFENYGPPESRGLYYPWFLQNQWILDGTAK
ncbi:hypothetical protein EIP86_007068 [Pleurotus ostreatoroseus]|nr:hypothetical protein EIP86_007068 [Pleurotus ostreatoroseus]